MCGPDQTPPKRQRWTAKAKLEVVLEGLRHEESVAELCRRRGITQSMYYAWRETLLQAGEEGLTYAGRTAREAALHKQLRAAQRAVGRLMLEKELLEKKREMHRPRQARS